MRNRAKCKLCESIIESTQRNDYVSCKCGEIAVDGGQDTFKCSARNFQNFLRIDDDGNIIVPTIIEKSVETKETPKPPTKEELLDALQEMIKKMEELPSQAMIMPVNHYDHYSLMLLLYNILRLKE